MNIEYNVAAERFDAFLARGDSWRSEYNVVKELGFRFDRDTFAWHTTEVGKLRTLFMVELPTKPSMSAAALAKAKELAAEEEKAIAASHATDADIDIPVPPGINLATGKPFAYLAYQKAGIAYAMRRQHTLIADEMGLGKTIQAIGINNVDSNIRRILVICPATLKLNWKKEFLKWDVKRLTVGLVSKGRKGEFPSTDVVIINYDLLGKWQDALRAVDWDLMVADECHYLKEGKTARTQEVFGRKRVRKQKKVITTRIPDARLAEVNASTVQVGEARSFYLQELTTKKKVEVELQPLPAIPAKRRVFLTGTPIVNRPKEMWTLIQALDPEGLGANWMKFALRYCGAVHRPFGWDFSGATNLDELQANLRASFMVRRLKKDVLKELPPKVRQVVSLETDGLTVKQRELLDQEKELEQECKSEGGSTTTPAFVELSRVRKQIALLKVPFVIELLQEMLNETEKIVVFAHHHDVVDKLAEAFGKGAVVLDGRVGNVDRQAAVERFQSDSSCRVFIGSIAAAGVGITLTAASTVVFAELDWVPGNLSQAEDRCHRIGQEEQVLIKHLVLEGSLDEHMANVLIGKQAVIDQALDTPNEDRRTIDALVPGEASQPETGAAGRVKDFPITATFTPYPQSFESALQPAPKPVQRWEDFGVTEEQAAAIHQGLKILAGMCDGAVNIDGHGFNKLDTNFGKILASASKLTPKMALRGKRMIRLYRGQLPPELVKRAGAA